MNNPYANVYSPTDNAIATSSASLHPYNRGYARGVADTEARLEWRRSTTALLGQTANVIFWAVVLGFVAVIIARGAHEIGRQNGIKAAQEAMERGRASVGSAQ